MKLRLLHILGMFCVTCALLLAPAQLAQAESPGQDNTSSEATAQTTETNTPSSAGNASGTAVNPFEAYHRVADPILSIDRDALFQRWFDWVAVENVNFESANEDGSLSEWQTDWFISHDWSDYGAVIATLDPGDAVTVNGKTILILGREIWPAGSINWDIYDAIGWDKVVFQTCLGDESIWIAYGLPVNPTPEFVAEHL